MTERAKKFLELVSKDAAMKEELSARLTEKGPEEKYAVTAAFAAEKGYPITAEELAEEYEVDDEELESVTGGKNCCCICWAGGVGQSAYLACYCVVAGGGSVSNGYSSSFGACACVGTGAGTTKA